MWQKKSNPRTFTSQHFLIFDNRRKIKSRKTRFVGRPPLQPPAAALCAAARHPAPLRGASRRPSGALRAPRAARAGFLQTRKKCPISHITQTSAMQAVQTERPDGHAGEGAEGGAGGTRSAQLPKTGNKAWLRRRLHGAIVRAHLAESESHRECVHRMDTFTVLCIVTWVKLLPF